MSLVHRMLGRSGHLWSETAYAPSMGVLRRMLAHYRMLRFLRNGRWQSAKATVRTFGTYTLAVDDLDRLRDGDVLGKARALNVYVSTPNQKSTTPPQFAIFSSWHPPRLGSSSS